MSTSLLWIMSSEANVDLIEDIALERDTKSLPKIEREAIPVRYWSCGFFLLVDFFLRDTLVRAVNPLRQEMRASQSLELPDANNSLEGVESLDSWGMKLLLFGAVEWTIPYSSFRGASLHELILSPQAHMKSFVRIKRLAVEISTAEELQ
ncbi:hypothetical protein Tco_1151849 [Tanacetum coccineum]